MMLSRLRKRLRFRRRRTLKLRRQSRHRKSRASARLGRALRARVKRLTSRAWGGSRAVTNEIIEIVDGRVAITSRKRWATFGNPGSDHHVSQVFADAIDFATDSNYALAREIARRLTGRDDAWAGDYDSFNIKRNGRWYRVQIIAGTHGTGPHLHVGVRRI